MEYAAARRPALRRTAYALCGDWHLADDIVQNALAKLYVAWPRVRRAAAEDAYVRQTIVRATIDESRRPWRRESTTPDTVDRPAPPGSDPDDRRDLVVALMQLPPMQRRTVVLRHWIGLSVAETARDLRISEGTVKSHTSRALERLQHLMTDAPEGSDVAAGRRLLRRRRTLTAAGTALAAVVVAGSLQAFTGGGPSVRDARDLPVASSPTTLPATAAFPCSATTRPCGRPRLSPEAPRAAHTQKAWSSPGFPWSQMSNPISEET